MNWEQIEGKWDKFKGNVKTQWGKLTDDDLMKIQGKKDKLHGALKERYGYNKEAAEKEIDSFLAKTKLAVKEAKNSFNKNKSI
ncbi:MAG: CsbD family protein [Proteobacteria bacterium]|nr:CsbD family protein [Pseudomonadota bacterium]